MASETFRPHAPSRVSLDRGETSDPQEDQEEYEDDGMLSEDSEGRKLSSESQLDVDESVREEMNRLEETFKEIGMKFRLIDRIGEGTFSTVYKAEDLHYGYYQNKWDVDPKDAMNWPNKHGSSHASSVANRKRPEKAHFVAIKKIYVTSSPMRIQNELELLHDLRGCKAVCSLITAIRHQDQVVAVLPHFQHQDFRLFYRNMNVHDIKVYFRSLFEALAAVHQHGIIHRDIKPTNFLYDVNRERGVLVDFGLAEREGTDSSHCLCQDHSSGRRSKIQLSRAANQISPIGYPKNDSRPSRRANRAGTRGFRAPEVLLKCTAQTSKIDIWSVGVIMLTILAQRFPFFNSADDVDAMIEIATIFGRHRMKQCAMLHGSIFECNLNSVGEKGFSLSHIVQWSTSITRPEQADGLEQDVKETIRFLELLLELDQRKRLSARAALASDFLTQETYETEADEINIL